MPWRRKWQPTPVSLPGEFHGQRSLVGAVGNGVAKSWTHWATEHTHTHTGAQTWMLRWSQPREKKKRKQSLPEIRGSWCLRGQRAEPAPEGRCRGGRVSFHWFIRCQHHDHLVEHGRKYRFSGSTPHLLFQNLRNKDPRLCILNRFSRVSLSSLSLSLSHAHTHLHAHTHTHTHTLKFKNTVLNLRHFWNTVMSISREGDGTPLQCSCLENPMDGGAW